MHCSVYRTPFSFREIMLQTIYTNGVEYIFSATDLKSLERAGAITPSAAIFIISFHID